MITDSEYRECIQHKDGTQELIYLYFEREKLLMETREWQRASIAYEAYCGHTDNKSIITGDSLPDWVDLPLTVKAAWFTAAEAAYKYGKD